MSIVHQWWFEDNRTVFTNLLKNLEPLEFLGHEKRPTPTDDGVNGRFQMEAMRCTTFEDATLIQDSRKDFPSQIRIQSQVKIMFSNVSSL